MANPEESYSHFTDDGVAAELLLIANRKREIAEYFAPFDLESYKSLSTEELIEAEQQWRWIISADESWVAGAIGEVLTGKAGYFARQSGLVIAQRLDIIGEDACLRAFIPILANLACQCPPDVALRIFDELPEELRDEMIIFATMEIGYKKEKNWAEWDRPYDMTPEENPLGL